MTHPSAMADGLHMPPCHGERYGAQTPDTSPTTTSMAMSYVQGVHGQSCLGGEAHLGFHHGLLCLLAAAALGLASAGPAGAAEAVASESPISGPEGSAPGERLIFP